MDIFQKIGAGRAELFFELKRAQFVNHTAVPYRTAPNDRPRCVRPSVWEGKKGRPDGGVDS
jgi:hypothetical protein